MISFYEFIFAILTLLSKQLYLIHNTTILFHIILSLFPQYYKR